MKQNTIIWILLLISVLFAIYYVVVVYGEKQKVDKTKLICRIVQDSYENKILQDKEVGYCDGPNGLLQHLVLSEQKMTYLRYVNTKAPQDGMVHDMWGNGIIVVKTSAGIRVCSHGPDGIRNTIDDVIVE